MNIINLTGRLSKEPELKYTQSGKAVVQFTLAVTKRFKNKEGKFDADFINCQAWDKTAEFIANNTTKGNRVELTGTLQNNNYEKDGKIVYRDIVNVEQFTPVDWKDNGQQQNNQNYTRVDEDPFTNNKGPLGFDSSDLPF